MKKIILLLTLKTVLVFQSVGQDFVGTWISESLTVSFKFRADSSFRFDAVRLKEKWTGKLTFASKEKIVLFSFPDSAEYEISRLGKDSFSLANRIFVRDEQIRSGKDVQLREQDLEGKNHLFFYEKDSSVLRNTVFMEGNKYVLDDLEYEWRLIRFEGRTFLQMTTGIRPLVESCVIANEKGIISLMYYDWGSLEKVFSKMIPEN